MALETTLRFPTWLGRQMLQAELTLMRAFVPLFVAISLTAVDSGKEVAGQEVPDTSRLTISGTIYDSQTFAPVPDANLRFSDTDFAAETDEGGEFTLGGLLAGTYLLVVAAPGYQELRVSLRVERTGSLNIPLEPVMVEGGRARTNRIIGRIREAETARPVLGAEVTLSGVRGFQVTGSDGRFEFPSVPQGFTTLSIRRMGREPMTDELEVSGSETLELDIRLVPDPVELDPMVVTVTRRNSYLEDMGFYQRIERGYSGQHVSRESIEERDPRTLADVFQAIPGLRVAYDGLGQFTVLVTRSIRFSSGDGCVPQLMIDDVPSDIGWLEDIPPHRIAGIEFYGGVNAPLRYNNPCGVILIWTRRGDGGGQDAH